VLSLLLCTHCVVLLHGIPHYFGWCLVLNVLLLLLLDSHHVVLLHGIFPYFCWCLVFSVLLLLLNIRHVVLLHGVHPYFCWCLVLNVLLLLDICHVVVVKHSLCCYYLMVIVFFPLLWLDTTIALTLFCWLEFHHQQKKLLNVCNFNKLLHTRYIYIPKIVWFFFNVGFFPLYWRWYVNNMIKFDYARIICKLETLIAPQREPWTFLHFILK
jgi:hypothetical protein